MEKTAMKNISKMIICLVACAFVWCSAVPLQAQDRLGTKPRPKPGPTGAAKKGRLYDVKLASWELLHKDAVLGQNTFLILKLEKLDPNWEIQYDKAVLVPANPSYNPRFPDCFFRINPKRSTESTGKRRVGADGKITIRVPGWFQWGGRQHEWLPDNSPGARPYYQQSDHRWKWPPNCGFQVRMKVWKNRNESFYRSVNQFDIQLADYTTYTINNTWPLNEKIKYERSLGIAPLSVSEGACTGKSIGPKTYSVGLRKYKNDISIRIRSGPIGTHCWYHAKNKWSLPDGFFVKKIHVNWLPEGPPKKNNACFNSGGRNYMYDFYRAADIGNIVTGFEIPGYESRNEFRTTVQFSARLKCGITLVNDHGIRMVIEKIDLVGPKGYRFPNEYNVTVK